MLRYVTGPRLRNLEGDDGVWNGRGRGVRGEGEGEEGKGEGEGEGEGGGGEGEGEGEGEVICYGSTMGVQWEGYGVV